MIIKKIFTITELSVLTNKTRPTLYKYVSAYEKCNYNEIPYNFIQLFDLINKVNVTKQEVVEFCKKNFTKVDSDDELNKVIDLIKTNKDKLDFDKVIETIKRGIDNGKLTK